MSSGIPGCNSPIITYANGDEIPEHVILWQSLKAKTLKPDYLHQPLQVFSYFPDIRCATETAVSVNLKYGHKSSPDHVHANHVGAKVSERNLIAGQYPATEIDDINYTRFWHAAFAENATIVDLTNPFDALLPYYPSQGQKSAADVFGLTKVTYLSEQDNVYSYQIELLERPDLLPKTIQRYHFSKWPDHGVVSVQELHALVDRTEGLVPNLKDCLWVHCRGGIGRTGTLITALIIKERIKNRTMHQETVGDELVDLIAHLRGDRNHSFVENIKQFELLLNYAKSLF